MKDESANLDFLRATAVSVVLIFHTMLYWNLEVIRGHSIRPLGLFGVLLFFVHTTLVLMFSLRRQQAQYPNKPIFSGFMLRRIFRIYPLSIATVALILIFHIPQTRLAAHSLSWTHISASGWSLNFLLMQNLGRVPSVLGPLWSLPFEIQMYTVLPLLFLIANRSRTVWVVIGIWYSAVLLYVVSTFAPVSYFTELIQYVPNFIPGVIAYKLSSSRRRIPFYLWPVFVGALVVGYVAAAGTYQNQAVYLGWAACFLLGLGIPFFKELPAGRVRTAAHLIAKYSYGIYLFHYFAIWFGFQYLAKTPLAVQWSVYALLVTVLPVAFFHVLENPMIKLGNRVVKSIVPRMADTTPARDTTRPQTAAAASAE